MRTEPLRHDFLTAESAGMLEDVRDVPRKILVEGNSVAGVSEKISEHGLALLERLLAKIIAVELDQVEGAENRRMIVMPIAEEIEHGQARPIDDDRLAIDDAGPRWQSCHRQDDLRETDRKIIAVAGEQPDAVALAPGENAKAIVLDFMNPAFAVRWGVRRSWKARLQWNSALDAPPIG